MKDGEGFSQRVMGQKYEKAQLLDSQRGDDVSEICKGVQRGICNLRSFNYFDFLEKFLKGVVRSPYLG